MSDRFPWLRKSAAVVVLAMMVVGCGKVSDPAVGASNDLASATSVPEVAASAVSTPSDVTQIPLYGGQLFGLPIGLRDVRDLTWLSSVIVHGTVSQILPARRFAAENGPLGTQTPRNYYDMQIYTDYVVNVAQVFRGAATETVTVRQMGGQVDDVRLDTDDYPHMKIGDDLVLFLLPSDTSQPGDAHWATGVGQGYWLAKENQFAPYRGQFSPLDLAGIGKAVADALKQGPPEHPPLDLVPLEDAPPGPDLPTSATPVP